MNTVELKKIIVEGERQLLSENVYGLVRMLTVERECLQFSENAYSLVRMLKV